MVKSQAHHIFEPKYLLDYRLLKIINDDTLLLIISNRKEKKPNINDIKPCSTTEPVENARIHSWAPLKPSIKITAIT